MGALGEVTHLFAPGTTEMYWCPALATRSAPTRAELTTAGTDISEQVAEIAGWVVSGSDIAVPKLSSDFTGSRPGRTTAEESSITTYFDEAGDDTRTLWQRGTTGFIVIVDTGLVTAATPCAVFPVRLKSVSTQRSMEEQVTRILNQFSITGKPVEDALVPAAT